MPRGLLLGFPAHGHMRPLLAVAGELSSAGHHLTLYSSPDWEAAAAEAGALFRPYRDPFLGDFRFGPEQLPETPALLMGAVVDTLDLELEGIRAEDFDYVLHDSLAHAGTLLGRLLGVPAVCLISTFVLTPRVLSRARGIFRPPPSTSFRRKLAALRAALRERRRIRRGFGLRPPALRSLLCARSDANIVFTSRRFQPCAERFGPDYHFVGPPEVAAAGSQAAAEPLVFVSLGTLFNRDAALFETAFEALDGLGVRVIATTGGGLQPEELRTPSDRVEVHSFVDQTETLERASAAISRGGLNTVSECVAAEVPLLVIPELAEQAVVARQVHNCEVGAFLRRDRASAAAIRNRIERLMGEPGYRRRCREVAADFRAAGGARRAAELVDDFVSGRGISS